MEKDKKTKKKKSILSADISFGKVSDLNVALSIRHLSLMLKSGLALGESVQVMIDQTLDKRLKQAYADIYESIQLGKNLSESMSEHKDIFSDIVISIVNVGEQAGTLETNLVFLADYLKKANELKKKVKGALIYPAIVFTLTVGEMVGVIFLILPKLEDLFKSFPNIPPFTRAILAFSQFVRENSGFIGLGVIALFIANYLFSKTKLGKIVKDKIGLSFPVIKTLNRNNILATFSRTMNILLQSGLPLVSSLEIAAQTVGNSVYTKIFYALFESVKTGKGLALSMEKYKKAFPGTYIKMIEVGEKTGTLEENLFYLYDYHANEVDEMSNNIAQLLEPILLVFIGLMIGFLAIIIIGPIYQFTGSINA